MHAMLVKMIGCTRFATCVVMNIFLTQVCLQRATSVVLPVVNLICVLFKKCASCEVSISHLYVLFHMHP